MKCQNRHTNTRKDKGKNLQPRNRIFEKDNTDKDIGQGVDVISEAALEDLILLYRPNIDAPIYGQCESREHEEHDGLWISKDRKGLFDLLAKQ